MMIEDVEKGIFIKVTEDFTKYLDIITKGETFDKLKEQGYKLDRSVIGRFGLLLVLKHPEILSKHTDLLLAASSSLSTTSFMKKEIKN